MNIPIGAIFNYHLPNVYDVTKSYKVCNFGLKKWLKGNIVRHIKLLNRKTTFKHSYVKCIFIALKK